MFLRLHCFRSDFCWWSSDIALRLACLCRYGLYVCTEALGCLYFSLDVALSILHCITVRWKLTWSIGELATRGPPSDEHLRAQWESAAQHVSVAATPAPTSITASLRRRQTLRLLLLLLVHLADITAKRSHARSCPAANWRALTLSHTDSTSQLFAPPKPCSSLKLVPCSPQAVSGRLTQPQPPAPAFEAARVARQRFTREALTPARRPTAHLR